MGVNFYLRRMSRKKIRENNEDVPKIKSNFGYNRYARFVGRLADDSGLGALWTEYRQASRAHSEKGWDIIQAGNASLVESDQELKVLLYKMLRARRVIERRMDEEPLAEFLLAGDVEYQFTSKSCARIGPRLRAIAEKWEAAPEGWVGFRENAIEIADAMDFVAEHPDVVFNISG